MGMKNKILLVLVTITVLLSQSLWATDTERRQAKRIHDRLTGVPATNTAIDAMEILLSGDPTGSIAAQYAIDTAQNPNARYFYNVTLKNFAAPWTNEEQTVFTPLNDYTATVIGLVRDGADFRRILLYPKAVALGVVYRKTQNIPQRPARRQLPLTRYDGMRRGWCPRCGPEEAPSTAHSGLRKRRAFLPPAHPGSHATARCLPA